MPPAPTDDQPRLKWAIRCLSLAILLAVWQWYGSQPGVFAVAPPSKVLPELWQDFRSGELLTAAAGTLLTVIVGYGLSASVGIILGGAIALSAWARNTLEPLVNLLYTAPLIILIPLISVYLGYDFAARVFVVFSLSVFVIMTNTITGINHTPPALIDMAHAFNARPLHILRSVILPAALPNILLGLRLGLGLAFRGAIAAEVLLSVVNLGKFLIQASSTYNMPKMLAGIVFITTLGAFLVRLAEAIERRILARWHGQP